MLVLIVTVIGTLLVPTTQSSYQTCYVKTDNCLPSNNTTTPCYEWLNITAHFTQCIKTCKVLLFSPGIYLLNRRLSASNYDNISFIGTSLHTTRISCLNSVSLLTVTNLRIFKIINISWIGCGSAFEDINIPRSYATILLRDVITVEISNVVFKTRRGYALIGINLHRTKLSFLKISALRQASFEHGSTGGIMLLNPPLSTVTHTQLQNCFVLVDNCKFYNIKGTLESYHDDYFSLYHVATVIQLAFHQQVIVNISNTMFINIATENLPAISISYLINKLTTVTIINSVFKNISSIKSSLVEVNFVVQIQGLSLHKILFQKCIFTHNKANQLIEMFNHDTAVNISTPVKLTIQFVTLLFDANVAANAILKVNTNRSVLNSSVTIEDCSFLYNYVSDLRFKDIYSLALKGRNIFDNNCAKIQIYLLHLTSLNLQGNVSFFNDRVNILFYSSTCLMLDLNSVLSVTNNQFITKNDTTHCSNSSLFYIIPYTLTPDINILHISYCTNNLSFFNTSILFQSNTDYRLPMCGYPYNNCEWDHHCNQTHDSCDHTIYNDQSNCSSMPDNGGNIYFCKSANAKINSIIYPGQTISIPLISTTTPVSVTSYNKEGASVCEPSNYNICYPSQQVAIIYQTCTNLKYTIKSNSTDWCILCLKTVTHKSMLYSFNITLRECPLGLIHYNGSCICDPRLMNAVKGLTCNSDGSLIRPPYTWISAITLSHNVTDIAYSNECYMDYCANSVIVNFNMYHPNEQCLGNRDGVLCGKCPEGFSAVFGTSSCKKCTNTWLLLIPTLAVAGMVLVWLLFTLNLTVVDGDIYGYILYVNGISLYSARIFPSNYLIYFPILMSNLDLGIEACFYNGMTNYATTWLQFIFPVYVILLVIGLSFASKYSQVVERLTRKRVIPVIATLYLLAYNKMLLITTNVLLSYRTIHYLKTQKSETYWSLCTQTSLFGLEFVLLFIFCILILLLLLPTTILQLFPKYFLKYKLITKYLKPFLDAYQAPFKDTSYHFLGVEMIFRACAYACDSLRADYTAFAYVLLLLIYLAYLSYQQPFRSSLNSMIYAMYICNLGCMAAVFAYYPIIKTKMYTIMFNCLIGVGFAVFLGIVALHIFKYCLHGNVPKMCPQRLRECLLSICKHCGTHVNDAAEDIQEGHYVQFRDDLLNVNPNA